MQIGFLGFGEAPYNIALGFRAESGSGLTIRAYDALQDDAEKGAEIRRHAAEAAVELVAGAGEAARGTDVFFAAVPSSYTLTACREVLGEMRNDQIYADVSASTPATKMEIWRLLEPKGVLFADAAMLGSLPKDKHRVPITASGNGAAAFCEAMTPLGMRITVAGERAGAASAIKLMRSVFMKGISSCMYEMLQGADAYGVLDEVVASIAKSMDGTQFMEHLDRLVVGTALHAARRAAEMSGSEKMLLESGLDGTMSKASATKHYLIAEHNYERLFAGGKPGWREIIAAMRVEDRG